MISFSNTEIAFESKTNQSLKKAYRLFHLIGNPMLVKLGKLCMHVCLKLHLPIHHIIKKFIFSQFCGGETIEECSTTISHLNTFGIGSILDYSVEAQSSDQYFDDTTQEIIKIIRIASNESAIPFAVFKMTGIGSSTLLEKANSPEYKLNTEEKIAYDNLLSRIDEICSSAFAHGVSLFVDAEETWIQHSIDRICLDMMRKYNTKKAIVYNTIQMYRHDRLEYLKKIIGIAREENLHYGIKLVRGAYMEKERNYARLRNLSSPIQPDKLTCDKAYNQALEIIVQNIDVLSLCAGTHNENSSALLAQLMHTYNINKDDHRIYFSQLLGMSDHISFNLSKAGYNVAKYVPYGPVKELIPYLLRRAEENTSIAGQTGRELSLLSQEIKRRGI